MLNYLSRGKTEEKFRGLALKEGAVAYERCSFTRGSKYSDLIGNFWYFRKLVAEERWSLTRGGRSRRFDCITFRIHREEKKGKQLVSLIIKL